MPNVFSNKDYQTLFHNRDRLSDNTDDNSYINRIPIPLSRVWIRYRARAIAGVKGNFRHSWDDLACRYCDLGDDESQEHLEMCGGTEFERAGDEELEGSPPVLEKDDSEDCCGDQEERSSDMMSHVINCYSWYIMS